MDAVIVLLFLFMIFTLKFVQKSATKHALKETYSASLYSLRISKLPVGTTAEEMTTEIWSLMNEKLYKEGQVLDVQIVLHKKVVRNIRLIDFITKKVNFITLNYFKYCRKMTPLESLFLSMLLHQNVLIPKNLKIFSILSKNKVNSTDKSFSYF